jgi:hypothetical protein
MTLSSSTFARGTDVQELKRSWRFQSAGDPGRQPRARLSCGTEGGERGDRREVLTGGRDAKRWRESAGGGSTGRLEQFQAEKEKAKGIRWERPQNCRLNGKTGKNQRDECDGVLTFSQR